MTALVSKIAKAALDVGGKLNPDKTNSEQRYDYISADKILSVAGQALFSAGIVVIPQVDAQDTTLFEYTDAYGKPKKRYDSRVNFTFTVSDGENEIKLPWYGLGSDYTVPDKALYKAVTSGHKYFLMKLLCIGAGNEDGEHEGEDEPTGQRQQRRPASPTPTNGKQQPAPQVAVVLEVEQGELADVGEVVEIPAPIMSLDTARAVKNSAGVQYGDLDPDTLSHMSKSIIAALKKPGLTQAERDNYQYKLDAIRTILAAQAA